MSPLLLANYNFKINLKLTLCFYVFMFLDVINGRRKMLCHTVRIAWKIKLKINIVIRVYMNVFSLRFCIYYILCLINRKDQYCIYIKYLTGSYSMKWKRSKSVLNNTTKYLISLTLAAFCVGEGYSTWCCVLQSKAFQTTLMWHYLQL